jgi:Leucine Rich Repeat (LRR) protein
VAEPVRQRIVVPFAGHVIGEGFNSDSGERVGTPLNVGKVGDDPLAPGQTATFRFQMLTSQSSMEESLNIGAELEARYGLFSGGAKVDFAESSAVNSASTYILASCIVANALRFGSDFTPTPTAQGLIAAGDKDGFKAAFGDRFTQALHTGGEFHALVRITSSSTVHQQSIAASLHAELNGLFAAASFKGSLEAAEKDSASHTQVDIQVHQTGGVGEQVKIPGTDADRIREHMNRFATAANTNAAAYEAELLTYDTLALPFPPPEELEQKREILDDCLQRRRGYWSAISELTFAQSDDAELMFEDLPSKAELLVLQNEFRRVLNALMNHARAVSAGTIPPTVFVAENEPSRLKFKRRNASSFAVWWARAKNNDPTLLRDERLLIDDIARAVGGMLTVPVADATPETMERAADKLTFLGLNMGSDHLDFPRHSSIAVLPQMLDAPLSDFFAGGTGFPNLHGIEGFSRLEGIRVSDGALEELDALASVAGLRALVAWKNRITDLTPLAGLTNLRALDLKQNLVEDLSPLASLLALEELNILSNQVLSLEPLRGLPALRLLTINARHNDEQVDNPILDARALGASPRLANPLTSADEVLLAVFTREGNPLRSGLATRVRDTNRFQFVPDGGAAAEEIQVQGLFEWREFSLFPAPVVATAVRFPNSEVGVACTHPDDRTAKLPVAQLVPAIAGDRVGFESEAFASMLDFDRTPPHVLLEATAA